MNAITTPVITSFDDTAFRPELRSSLLISGDTRSGILTWQSQRLWWKENQRLGELMLSRRLTRRSTAGDRSSIRRFRNGDEPLPGKHA